MLRNRIVCSLVMVLSSFAAAASPGSSTTGTDSMQLVTPFNVSKSTQVPGKTLRPGMYSIRVVDHLTDRVILQIEDAKGMALTRFLAIDSPALRLDSQSTGPVSWTNGSHQSNTLRGYIFPGGSAVEFVYPKADAVQIAKANAERVPAIDPTSEGRVEAKNLPKEDLETVTLWTLLSTRVGPEGASQPAIEAQKYKGEPRVETAQTANEEPFRVSPTGLSPRPRSRRSVTELSRPAPQLMQTATTKRAGLAALPHTASLQPLLALLAMMMLMVGGWLRYARVHGREI